MGDRTIDFLITDIIYTIILLKYIAVSQLQVAILARLSPEMSQTVRNDWQYILQRIRVSVRPSNFCIREKHKSYREDRVPRKCLLNVPVTVDRLPATTWAATTVIIAPTDWAKTAKRVYTFTTWKMWFKLLLFCSLLAGLPGFARDSCIFSLQIWYFPQCWPHTESLQTQPPLGLWPSYLRTPVIYGVAYWDRYIILQSGWPFGHISQAWVFDHIDP